MEREPTEEDYARVKDWPITDPTGWFNFIHDLWWAADWGWKDEPGVSNLGHGGRWYNISTGGHSINEDLISAMRTAHFLWMTTWQSSRRGGHYSFFVPDAKDHHFL